MHMTSNYCMTAGALKDPRQFRIFRALLKGGADPNLKDTFSDYPLRRYFTSEMSSIGEWIPYISLLLLYDANPLQL